MKALTYRADIDGLRMIAVGAVLLFHAGIPGFRGGFVGVDVFFVISGYLISQLILRSIESGGFSIAEFYDRRMRRIFPALFVVYLFTTVGALVLLLPRDLEAFGRSLASSAAFLLNVLFFNEAGYFDAPAHDKPLLHTWSLSVEEQFYVIWPWVLVAVASRRRLRVPVLVAVLVVSFALSEWESRSHAAAAFYLLHSRAWELLLGALLAVSRLPQRLGPRTSEVAAALGLVLVAVGIVRLSAASHFPGWHALFPCLGTAMIICAGGGTCRTAVNRLLEHRAVVFTGQISYSLYLWHWPLLSLSRYVLGRPLTVSEAVLALAASYVLAVLSWRFVEQPFRTGLGRRGSRPLRLVTGVAGCVLFVGMSSVCVTLQRWPSRFPPSLVAVTARASEKFSPDCYVGSSSARDAHLDCELGAPRAANRPFQAVMFGDSHAHALLAGMAELFGALGLSGSALTERGCPPIWGVHRVNADRVSDACERLLEGMDRFLRQNGSLDLVILAARWALYAQTERPLGETSRSRRVYLTDDRHQELSRENSRAVLSAHLEETVVRLASQARRVVLVGQVPPFGSNPIRCVSTAMRWKVRPETCAVDAAYVRQRLEYVKALLRRIARRVPNVTVVFPDELTCGSETCVATLNGVYLYKDDDHLNPSGARELVRELQATGRLALNDGRGALSRMMEPALETGGGSSGSPAVLPPAMGGNPR